MVTIMSRAEESKCVSQSLLEAGGQECKNTFVHWKLTGPIKGLKPKTVPHTSPNQDSPAENPKGNKVFADGVQNL